METNKKQTTQKTMAFGETEFLKSECPQVIWHSSNPDVVTINAESGLAMAQSAGNAVITATLLDGGDIVTTYDLSVEAAIPVTGIQLDRETFVLYKDKVDFLRATVIPENATNKSIYWRSTNTESVKVDSNTGMITAMKVGDAHVYAVSIDNEEIEASCKITVRETTVCPTVENPVNAKRGNAFASPVDVYTGAHRLSNTLMSLFGGQGLTLVAQYDSTQLGTGDLGIGWHHNYEKHIESDSDGIYVYNNPSTYSIYKLDDDGTYKCQSPNRNGYILTMDATQQYPFVIDCNSAFTECYNANGKLAKVINHQGFEVSVDYVDTLITITDCVSQKKLYMEKNTKGQVIRVYDDAQRETMLNYDNDHLTSIEDANGNMITYTYDNDNRITSGTDAVGNCYFENTYDRFGHIKAQKDANLNSRGVLICYDGETRTTTNKLGMPSYREYNKDGLLSKYVDENGNSKIYEYDDCYNVTKEIDINGKSISKEYNNFNKPTQVTDKNGNTTYFTYDSKGNVVKITYPTIGDVVPEESFEYNDRNQMTKHIDLRGTVTLYTYDANGMPATQKIGDKNPIVYTYQNGLLVSQKDPKGNTTKYEYDNRGLLVKQTDAENKVTQYEYDAVGNLTCVTDADSKKTEIIYNGNYQKTSVKDARGKVTNYTYNGNMKNTATTFADNTTVQYKYDEEDRLIKIIDQEGKDTLLTYDDGGRLISKKFADNSVVRYEYDTVGNLVKEFNPKNVAIERTYDAMGNVKTLKDDKGTTCYEYNAMNKVTKITNPFGGVTTFTYSVAGDLLSETDALGKTKEYGYDAYGNRVSVKDAKGNETTYIYDANNNLTEVKDALGNTTKYAYNSLNQCASVTDPLNNKIEYEYDALGRRTAVIDALGNRFETDYDENGNVVQTRDAKNNVISETQYNDLNKPVSITDAMGKKTEYTYNALGLVQTVTDPKGQVTEFAYDACGRNTSVKDALGNISTATYDALGNVIQLQGPSEGATNYTYDDMGRLKRESTVSGGTKQYEYNALNVISKITNARGQVREISYDVKGRVTGYTSPEGNVSYTYDANDNVLTVTDSHGTITRTYDALNRVISYTDTYGNTIGYEYNTIGKLSKLIYPDGTAVTYEYNENHNLIKVTDWANRVTTYTYDVNNRVVGVTKPDGSVTTTAYDDKQRVTSAVTRTAAGVVITGFEYTYDELSRIVEEKALDKNTKICYNYDTLSRVTERTVKNATTNAVISTETFTYDAAGNITGGSADDTFVYDTNNRLVSYNGSTVIYDADGNMLSNGSLTCTYDSANRLITAGGHTYTYNAEGVRIRNQRTDADTTYVYDTNCRLSKLLCKTTNGFVTKYVYGGGLIGEEKCGNFKTYHFDNRGSTVAITNANGNIIDTFEYDTYGKLISRTGSSFVIFGYNGRDGVVTDANGLIYMRARYYSPDMRRFVNADIVAGKISNAVTLNRFAYANGNPVSLVDPSGLWSFKSAWNSFTDWVEETVVDPIVETYEEVKQAVVEAYNDAKDTVVEACNEVADVVVDAYNYVADRAVEVGNNVADKTVDAYNYVADGATKLHQNVSNKAVTTYNVLKDGATDVLNDAKKDIRKNIVEPITPVVNNVVQDLKKYDKNNTDVQKVYESHYFSAYKGTFLVNHSIKWLSSGALGNLILLKRDNNEAIDDMKETLEHESGHVEQHGELGSIKYALYIFLPSAIYNLAARNNQTLSDNYFYMPWEYDANVRVGLTNSTTPSWAPIVRYIYFGLID